MSFSFVGNLPSSKSLMNRALIVQSYFEDFYIQGESDCDDIFLMKKSIKDLKDGLFEFDCGHSATALRFLSLRLARREGSYTIKSSQRLMKRLPEALVSLLMQLGCEVEILSNALKIKSKEGWKPQGDGIYVPTDSSSQFASALLLNSWDLPHTLYFQLGQKIISESYFEMTKKFLKKMGLEWSENGNEFIVKPRQRIIIDHFSVEQDLSSAFVIGVLATLFGSSHILDFPKKSLQPDAIFPDLLLKAGAKIEFLETGLKISKATVVKPLSLDLSNNPDLFPCLAVLLAFAQGRSVLSGLEHLKNKESDRVEGTFKLLEICKVEVRKTNSSLEITGPIDFSKLDASTYCAGEDHRMAMAAGILQKAGAPIKIGSAQSVSKSFPEFWNILKGISL